MRNDRAIINSKSFLILFSIKDSIKLFLHSNPQPIKEGPMKRILASVILVVFVATGCTGSFNLTKKVYNFHRSQSDKWADELCFLLVVLVPVYSLATFADAIV